jgi:hypothetical protein
MTAGSYACPDLHFGASVDMQRPVHAARSSIHWTLIADSAAAQRIVLQGEIGQLGAPVGGRMGRGLSDGEPATIIERAAIRHM